MAVLNDPRLPIPGVPVDSATIRIIQAELARQFWAWYSEHQNDIVVSRRVLMFSVNIRVRDLRPVFVQLFGEPVP